MSNEYFTKDLGEAAALLTVGIKLLRLSRDESFFWFVFEESSCSEASNAYWSGDLMISAKMYSTNMRLLKDRLFAQR